MSVEPSSHDSQPNMAQVAQNQEPPDHVFRCPVCRARQRLAPICRRCKADLSLVIQARHRRNYVTAALKTELSQQRREQLTKELKLLNGTATNVLNEYSVSR